MPPGAQRITDGNIAHRQRPDQGAGRLRSGVTTGADQERDKEGECDGGLELGLEVTQHGARQALRQEQKHEPADALAGDRKIPVRK